jgi:hypothetical protein
MLLNSPHELSLLKERNPPLADALLSGNKGMFISLVRIGKEVVLYHSGNKSVFISQVGMGQGPWGVLFLSENKGDVYFSGGNGSSSLSQWKVRLFMK